MAPPDRKALAEAGRKKLEEFRKAKAAGKSPGKPSEASGDGSTAGAHETPPNAPTATTLQPSPGSQFDSSSRSSAGQIPAPNGTGYMGPGASWAAAAANPGTHTTITPSPPQQASQVSSPAQTRFQVVHGSIPFPPSPYTASKAAASFLDTSSTPSAQELPSSYGFSAPSTSNASIPPSPPPTVPAPSATLPPTQPSPELATVIPAATLAPLPVTAPSAHQPSWMTFSQSSWPAASSSATTGSSTVQSGAADRNIGMPSMASAGSFTVHAALAASTSNTATTPSSGLSGFMPTKPIPWQTSSAPAVPSSSFSDHQPAGGSSSSSSSLGLPNKAQQHQDNTRGSAAATPASQEMSAATPALPFVSSAPSIAGQTSSFAPAVSSTSNIVSFASASLSVPSAAAPPASKPGTSGYAAVSDMYLGSTPSVSPSGPLDLSASKAGNSYAASGALPPSVVQTSSALPDVGHSSQAALQAGHAPSTSDESSLAANDNTPYQPQLGSSRLYDAAWTPSSSISSTTPPEKEVVPQQGMSQDAQPGSTGGAAFTPTSLSSASGQAPPAAPPVKLTGYAALADTYLPAKPDNPSPVVPGTTVLPLPPPPTATSWYGTGTKPTTTSSQLSSIGTTAVSSPPTASWLPPPPSTSQGPLGPAMVPAAPVFSSPQSSDPQVSSSSSSSSQSNGGAGKSQAAAPASSAPAPGAGMVSHAQNADTHDQPAPAAQASEATGTSEANSSLADAFAQFMRADEDEPKPQQKKPSGQKGSRFGWLFRSPQRSKDTQDEVISTAEQAEPSTGAANNQPEVASSSAPTSSSQLTTASPLTTTLEDVQPKPYSWSTGVSSSTSKDAAPAAASTSASWLQPSSTTATSSFPASGPSWLTSSAPSTTPSWLSASASSASASSSSIKTHVSSTTASTTASTASTSWTSSTSSGSTGGNNSQSYAGPGNANLRPPSFSPAYSWKPAASFTPWSSAASTAAGGSDSFLPSTSQPSSTSALETTKAEADSKVGTDKTPSVGGSSVLPNGNEAGASSKRVSEASAAGKDRDAEGHPSTTTAASEPAKPLLDRANLGLASKPGAFAHSASTQPVGHKQQSFLESYLENLLKPDAGTLSAAAPPPETNSSRSPPRSREQSDPGYPSDGPGTLDAPPPPPASLSALRPSHRQSAESLVTAHQNPAQFQLLQQHIDELTEEKLELQRGLAQQAKLNASMSEENMTLAAQYNAQGKALEELKKKLERYESELEAQAISMENMASERESAKTNMQEAASRATALAAEVVSLEQQMLQIKSGKLKLEQQWEAQAKQMSKLERQLASLQKERASTNEELEQAKVDKRNMFVKLRQTEVKLAALAEAAGDAPRVPRTSTASAMSHQEVQCDIAAELSTPETELPDMPGSQQGATSRVSDTGGQEVAGATEAEEDSPTDAAFALDFAAALGSTARSDVSTGHDVTSAIIAERALSNLSGPPALLGTAQALEMLSKWLPQGPVSSCDPVAAMAEEEVRLVQSIHELLAQYDQVHQTTLHELVHVQAMNQQLQATNAELRQKLEPQAQRMEFALPHGAALDPGSPMAKMPAFKPGAMPNGSVQPQPVSPVVTYMMPAESGSPEPEASAQPARPVPAAAAVPGHLLDTERVPSIAGTISAVPGVAAVRAPVGVYPAMAYNTSPHEEGRPGWLGFLFKPRPKKRVRNALL